MNSVVFKAYYSYHVVQWCLLDIKSLSCRSQRRNPAAKSKSDRSGSLECEFSTVPFVKNPISRKLM